MECKFEKVIDTIQEDIREIRTDVRTLLKFKWSIMGGAAIGGTLLAFIINKIW